MTSDELEQLQRAATGGDADAWYRLGLLYDNAPAEERDPAKAANCYREAAELAHALAMNNLGVMTLNGDGVPQNVSMAFSLIKMSAARDNAQAMFNLGLMFERGLGTAADPAQALAWMERAQKAGHTGAAEALARMRAPDSSDTHFGATPPPPPPPAPAPAPGRRRGQPFVVALALMVVLAGLVLGVSTWRKAQWPKALNQAATLESAGRFTDAIAQLQTWADQGPHQVEARQKIQALQLKQADGLLAAGQPGPAAKLLESLGEKARAAAAYETAGQLTDAERLNVAAGRVKEMADIYAARGKWDDAVRLYEAAKAVPMAVEILRKNGRLADAINLQRRHGFVVSGEECEAAGLWADAGAAYERELKLEKAARAYQKAGDARHAAALLGRTGAWREAASTLEELGAWDDAALIYEKQQAWSDAARLYLKTGNQRRAATALENDKRYREAAEAYEALAKSDRDVTVRTDAARLYHLAGMDDKARLCWADALSVAKSFGNYKEILSISKSMGQLKSGIEYVADEGDRLQNQEELFEAEEAYDSVSPYLGQDSPFDVDTHNRLVARLNAAIQAISARIEAYPKLDNIEGVNNYTDHAFSNTEIHGALRNTTGRTISSVTIRIKLFKKSLQYMWQGGVPPVSNAAMEAFTEGKAGYSEDIVLTGIAPGETRTFSQRLGNTVPYEYFNYPMSGLR